MFQKISVSLTQYTETLPSLIQNSAKTYAIYIDKEQICFVKIAVVKLSKSGGKT
jgi:hypothetical protein